MRIPCCCQTVVPELLALVSNLELERRVLRRELSEAELTIRGLRGALATLSGRRR